MGITCCAKLVIKESPSFEREPAEIASTHIVRLSSFYHENKNFMGTKLRKLFKDISKTQEFNGNDVNLSFVNFGRAKIDQLVELLPYFTHIQHLSLWKCDLGGSSIKGIKEGLSHLQNLLILSLADNGMNSEGIMHLADALQHLRKLRELWLHINDIGPTGAVYLTDILVNLEELEKLGIDENFIENAGSLKIAEALKASRKLKYLGLGYNNISQEVCLEILEKLKCVPLEKIVLSGNDINESAYDVIKEIVPNTEVIM